MAGVKNSDMGVISRLSTQNIHLRSAIDQVEEGVIILELYPQHGAGPCIVFANRGIGELSGFPTEELLGCSLSKLFGPEKLQALLERLNAVAEVAEKENVGVVFEFTNDLLRAKKRSPLLCRWRVSCVLDESGRAVNFLLSVARVAMAAEFHSTKIDAKDGDLNLEVGGIDETQRESFLGRVEVLAISASGFAHDFKNILTTIIANLSLVRESVTDASILSGIDDAIEASIKGEDLANDLLSQARAPGQSHREEKNIGELLTAAARMSTAGSGAHCEVSIEGGVWSANVNGSQIFQLINNLIINARHAMDDSGTIFANLNNIELTEHCVEGLDRGEYLQLEVIDHGCGIPKKDLDKIFNRLYTTKTSGSGLGLSNCQTIILDHGGVITVDSIKDRGTSFKVYLPATGTTESVQKDQRENTVYSGRGSVLVVDDDDAIIDISSKLLIKLGYEIECANSGSESVMKYRRRLSTGNSFAAVLMDMTMPGGIDGKEAAQQILDIDPNAKIISCSGYNSGDLVHTLEPKGKPVFSGILSKPFDIQTISAKLREAINPVEG